MLINTSSFTEKELQGLSGSSFSVNSALFYRCPYRDDWAYGYLIPIQGKWFYREVLEDGTIWETAKDVNDGSFGQALAAFMDKYRQVKTPQVAMVRVDVMPPDNLDAFDPFRKKSIFEQRRKVLQSVNYHLLRPPVKTDIDAKMAKELNAVIQPDGEDNNAKRLCQFLSAWGKELTESRAVTVAHMDKARKINFDHSPYVIYIRPDADAHGYHISVKKDKDTADMLYCHLSNEGKLDGSSIIFPILEPVMDSLFSKLNAKPSSFDPFDL